MSTTKFIKDIGLIGFSQVLTSLGAFLLLPIITKSLGSYDYGIWAQINVTISLLSPLAMMGLSMGFVRFFSSVDDKDTIKEGLYSILFFIVCSSFLISLILFFSADIVSSVLFQNQNASYFIKIASFLIFFNAIDTITLFYFRVFRQINKFCYFSIFQSLGKLALAAMFLWKGFGLFGVILAFLSIQMIVFIVSMYEIISQIGFIIPKFIYIKEYLKFSLPLTPNSLIRWITDSSDRYLVTYYLGLGSVGIYSAAYSIGWLIQLFISPIQLILYPELSKLYDEGREEDVKLYLSYSLRYFLMLTIPAVFGLAALAKPLLAILTTESFVAGWFVIPIIAFAGLFAGVVQIIINISHLVKQTKYNFHINLLAAITNIILNVLLIPLIGIMGAAVATTISYILMLIICVYVTSKYLWFDIDLISILKFVIASFIMFVVVYLYSPETTIELIGLSFIGSFIYVISIFILKGFNRKEIEVIQKTLYKLGK